MQWPALPHAPHHATAATNGGYPTSAHAFTCQVELMMGVGAMQLGIYAHVLRPLEDHNEVRFLAVYRLVRCCGSIGCSVACLLLSLGDHRGGPERCWGFVCLVLGA